MDAACGRCGHALSDHIAGPGGACQEPGCRCSGNPRREDLVGQLKAACGLRGEQSHSISDYKDLCKSAANEIEILRDTIRFSAKKAVALQRTIETMEKSTKRGPENIPMFASDNEQIITAVDEQARMALMHITMRLCQAKGMFYIQKEVWNILKDDSTPPPSNVHDRPLPLEVQDENLFAEELDAEGGYTTVGIVHRRDQQWLRYVNRLEKNGELR